MAFKAFKRIFGGREAKAPPVPVHTPPVAAPEHRPVTQKKKGAGTGKWRRVTRGDASPYTGNPALVRENMARLGTIISKSAAACKTDRFTLLEIADRILHKEIGAPRPPLLRAHHIFEMFVKEGRKRAGVSGACSEWRGAYKAGAPVLTTVNSIHGHRLLVDARKYILENPVRGRRRNFRSTPHNRCGNARCVNPKHIEMRGLPREMKSGENHARAKYSDKLLQKLVREYNAGATAKELAKKHGMSLTYVEQVMRKERRTKATQGMKIRARFGEW